MTNRSSRITRLLAAYGLLGGILACGGSSEDAESTEPAPTEAQPTSNGVRIQQVIFARELDDEWNPVGGPVTDFRADESTIWARVTIEGRPRATITMRWMWRDLQMASTDLDLGNVNDGVFFSFGQDTYLRGVLRTNRLYIGDGHRLLLMQGDTELGSYSFRVVPPEGARPSRFVAAQLYRAFNEQTGPSEPTTTFQTTDNVVIAGQAALGNRSWFDARFTVNGTVDSALTLEAIGPADGGDVRNFHFMRRPPDGGWPVGSHRVELILDDRTVATYDFAVAQPG